MICYEKWRIAPKIILARILCAGVDIGFALGYQGCLFFDAEAVLLLMHAPQQETCLHTHCIQVTHYYLLPQKSTRLLYACS